MRPVDWGRPFRTKQVNRGPECGGTKRTRSAISIDFRVSVWDNGSGARRPYQRTVLGLRTGHVPALTLVRVSGIVKGVELTVFSRRPARSAASPAAQRRADGPRPRE